MILINPGEKFMYLNKIVKLEIYYSESAYLVMSDAIYLRIKQIGKMGGFHIYETSLE